MLTYYELVFDTYLVVRTILTRSRGRGWVMPTRGSDGVGHLFKDCQWTLGALRGPSNSSPGPRDATGHAPLAVPSWPTSRLHFSSMATLPTSLALGHSARPTSPAQADYMPSTRKSVALPAMNVARRCRWCGSMRRNIGGFAEGRTGESRCSTF